MQFCTYTVSGQVPVELDGYSDRFVLQVFLGGFHGDTSETFIVGDTDAEGEVLIDTAIASRNAGIKACGPGVPFTKIGAAIR